MLQFSSSKTPALLTVSLTLLAASSSCSRNSSITGADLQDPAAKAPARIEASLRADSSKRLTIQKQSLGKEFLLHGSYAPQERNATSTGLKARVITFHRAENSVFMLESTEGRLVSEDVPTRIILAEFPVLDESDQTLTVDFNAGMKSVFSTSALYASDVSGKGYQTGDAVTQVATSFIDSIRTQDNTVEIRQIARLDLPNGMGSESAHTYELRYYLSPYRPNENFEPRQTSDFRRVGYFETKPTLVRRTGETRVHITRRDENKVFTYSISANTPADKVQAIRDGVLYWNTVFGREVVRVDMAPEGVTAPDSRYNVIQWIDDHSTTSAYADMLADPRTGEILHSQIFIHSGLFGNSGNNLVGFVRRLNAATEKPSKDAEGQEAASLHKGHLHLKGLSADPLCDVDFTRAFAEEAHSLLALDLAVTPEVLNRISDNYVRMAVAHEVGHTLGLRHNFAGSLANSMSIAERDAHLANYLKTEELASDLLVSSSVMEYTTMSDSTIVGGQVKSGTVALPYDKAAIEWGYRGTPMPADAPFFCTDTDRSKFADCTVFDSGSSAVLIGAERMDSYLKILPIQIVEEFIRMKTNPASGSMDPSALLDPLVSTLGGQIAWLTNMTRPSVVVERIYGEQTSNLTSYQAYWVDGQVRMAGGLDKLLFAYLPTKDRPALSFAETGVKELEAYLNRPEVVSGIGYDGKPYRLNEGEIASYIEQGAIILQALDSFLLSQLLELYGRIPLATLYAPMIEERLGSIASEVVLRQAPLFSMGRGFSLGGESGSANDSTPVGPRAWQYYDAHRLSAAKLLSAKYRPVGFGEPQRLDLIESLRALIRVELGADVNAIDVRKLTPEQRRWFNVQREVLKALQNSAKTE